MPLRVALLAAFPLHVIPGFEAHRPSGHYATWLPQLAQHFAQRDDLEIHWIVTSKTARAAEPVRWLNQAFHILHLPIRARILQAYRQDTAAIAQRVHELGPDLVHAWGSEDCYALAGARCRRPWLLSMQGILREYLRRVPMPWLVHLQALYERWAVRRAREICGESPWSCEVMQRYAPQARVHLVEYGVQPLFYEQTWQPDPVHPVAVFAGTPEPRKGIADAIQAFAHPTLAHAKLHIIGNGDPAQVQALRASAPPNVVWRGRLSPQETAAALAQAWCLVMPTRADTGPMVVKEARVIGLPVVSTPHGGQSFYITPGENGFLREPGDVGGFAHDLATLLSSYDTTRRMGAAHWQEQRRYFHPQATAENFAALYHSLAPAPRP